MDQPPDPFEFLKNLWGPMGLPLAGVMAPTHIQDELGRRIAELKSVENWLNMNLNVLRLTIQGLEMQKAGLAAMQAAAASVPPGPAEPAGDREDPPKK
ncbi:MAG TPA: PhaM family polyhydroxyalkanoate granule multifunctional regulatory protein [Burkholderiales bacterium]|nr:PhaM family polyhydroxyalkanoate granule multifunctional regulatory protein [Burkholderiales bacterium]